MWLDQGDIVLIADSGGIRCARSIFAHCIREEHSMCASVWHHAHVPAAVLGVGLQAGHVASVGFTVG